MSRHVLGYLVGIVLAVVALSCSATAADADGVKVTPENPTGWRGDGSGQYPDCNAPTQWSHTGKSVLALRTQAKKPASDGPGGAAAMPDGAIHEWLVLGPVESSLGVTPAAMDKETFAGEAAFAPDSDQKVGDKAWKIVKSDAAALNFNEVVCTAKDKIAYAHTYVYSPADSKFAFQLASRNGMRFWVNGKMVSRADDANGSRMSISLKKGWNSLLFKTAGGVSDPKNGPANDSWYVCPVFYGSPGCEYQSTNIRWATPMPQGFGAPIIVGDKLFVLAEPDLLFCIDKHTGNILWVRTNTTYDGAIAAAPKENAAELAKIEPLSKRLEAIYEAYGTATPPDAKALGEAAKIRDDMHKKLKAIDNKKYDKPASDVGYTGVTPCSDGTHVYVWLASAVTACYDLDGNRKWIRFDDYDNFEHGWCTSPVVIEGKVIIYMRDVIALKADTGEVAWKTPHTSHEGQYGGLHGSFCRATIGGTNVVILGTGQVIRVSDGKVLVADKRFNQTIVTPVVDKGPKQADPLTMVDGLIWAQLPDKAQEGMKFGEVKSVRGNMTGLPNYYGAWDIASPLVYDGLVYSVNGMGVLVVADMKEGKIVYQKYLDLNQFEFVNDHAGRGVGCSPALAGKYIYIMSNFGACVVIKPGRTFEQVAKNRLEAWTEVPGASWYDHVQKTVASPIFDSNCMYYRGESNLYCIGGDKS